MHSDDRRDEEGVRPAGQRRTLGSLLREGERDEINCPSSPRPFLSRKIFGVHRPQLSIMFFVQAVSGPTHPLSNRPAAYLACSGGIESLPNVQPQRSTRPALRQPSVVNWSVSRVGVGHRPSCLTSHCALALCVCVAGREGGGGRCPHLCLVCQVAVHRLPHGCV